MTQIAVRCENCGHVNMLDSEELEQPDLAEPLDDEPAPRLRSEDKPPEWGIPLDE